MLITDLQSGSDLSELDRFEWPEEVRVDIRQVTAEGATNASLVLLSEQAVRVFNTADASRSQFRLGWADTQGKLQGDREYPVHVPPGESRVVRIEPHASSDRLMLIGDDHSFDNTLYIARRTARSRTLLYLGAATDDRSNLLYYLRRAALDTSWQTVQAECQPPDSPVIPGSPLFELDPERTPLVVIGATLPETAASHLRTRYVEHGGHVLVVLTQPSVTDPAFARSLRVLLGLPSVTIEEVETTDYVMLEDIDFRHPLFLPFADPKFSDFTKIRFWTHRRLAADEDPTWDVLASFDDGTPALVEQRVGKGTCRVLTSGWQPEESQLALSTKFVPLLAGMLDPMGGQPPVAASYFVGQPVAVPNSDEPGRVVSPDGQEHALVDATVFTNTDVPGIYAWEEGERSEPFAVNIVSRESRTEPLDPGQLEQRGVRTGKSRTMDAIQQQRRQLRDMELESRQKWWRWLIAGAIGVLLVETWLGGWLSRRRNAD